MSGASTDRIRGVVDGALGRIVLDRPRALNALTLPMIEAIAALLDAWRDDPAVRTVLVESAVDGVFCAGGDVRAVREHVLAGEPERGDAFFAAEYRVNLALGTYPKPVVALIDGVCMGGGLGISVHGPFRVVTERAVLAMPETAIGFVPDVGASHVLPRLPGGVGMYLGLTGARLSAADAVAIGLATHFIPSARAARITDRLVDGAPPAAVLDELAGPPGEPSAIEANRTRIDAVFTAPTLDGMLERLARDDSEWGESTRAAIAAASPRSLRLTVGLLGAGRDRTLAECVDAECVLAREMIRHPDFAEGVRAVLVDKDRAPRWSSVRD